jgi:Xaa-Pro aminopeptidase
VPTWQEWTAEQSTGGKTVAVDPQLITGATAKKLAEKLKRSGGRDLVALDENLVDLAWAEARPPRPSEPVTVLPDRLAGKDVMSKLKELRRELAKKDCPGFLVSMLDEIAWLFNLRGSDILYNPVFFSYAIVTPDNVTLYTDSTKLSPECRSHLSANDVSVKPYRQIFADAQAMCETISNQQSSNSHGSKRFMISTKTSWALKRSLGGDELVDEVRSPIGDAKAVKNETEMEGMRACHIRDGSALIEFFAWLEDELIAKKAILDEVAAADKLEQLRAKQKDFVGLSFDTISSTGAR